MKPDRWKKVETICQKAMRLQGEKRSTYLDNACAGDPDLLEEVTSLLEQEEQDWLQDPIVNVQSSFVFSDDRALSDQTIGPYRVIKMIGSGGMGNVYLAVRDDDQFERFVALKVIRKGLVSDDVLKRFYSERQILASLNHPNIARLFDGGTTEDGIPWFAMEHVEGAPITDYCKRYNLTVDEKIQLFLKVCSAVQYAHQNLVIHRDLKPANILITPQGIPKLLDFGIAKLTDLEQRTGQTQIQDRIMTPEYASPEQVRDESISTVSDVYSLGVLLYELLAGTLPYEFEKRTPAGIEMTITRKIPKRPSSVSGNIKLKGDLDSIILKAMRKEPSERYTSVEQLANDLHRHKKALPVLARKDTFTYHARKFLSRNKWSVAVSTAIALLVIAFAVVTFLQSKEIEARAVEAEQQRERAEQVSNFLTDLFESADPSEAGNESITAVELLHRGADRVENELDDQPRLQAELYLVISDVYESLGLFDEGLALAQKAYDLQTDLYGMQHAEIARSLNAMGWLYRQKNEYPKADSLLTAALAMRRDLFGDLHPDVARTMNDLAVLKQSRGDYEATDTLLSAALDIRRELLGDTHESVGVTLSNYAALKWRMGEIDTAEKLLREVLTILRSNLGEEHLRVATAMTNLAAVLVYQDKPDEAEPLYRRALEIRVQLVGNDHPDVAASLSHLGNLLRIKGAYEEAETHLRKALELRTQIFGAKHNLVGDSERVLGYLYEKMGEIPKAVEYYSRSIATFRDLFPDGHAFTARVLQSLGELYLKNSDPGKAKQPLQEALDIQKQVYGEKNNRTAVTMIRLGLCLKELGKTNEARPLLNTGLRILNNTDDLFPNLKSEAEQALAGLE